MKKLKNERKVKMNKEEKINTTCHPEEGTYSNGEEKLCSGSLQHADVEKMLNSGDERKIRRFMLQHDRKAAFTLAETLITLTILGVVAAITVPSLVNKQIESANRTKVKKAMAVYEKALNQMIIDNDVKGSLSSIDGFGTNCAKSTEYFKKVKQKSDCVFKTADKVWWDITDIENPIIMLKDKYTDGTYSHAANVTAAQIEDNKEVFALLGHRDNSGILRVNDKGFEDGQDIAANKTYMKKLYGFMNNEVMEEDDSDKPLWQKNAWLSTPHSEGETNCDSGYKNCYYLSQDLSSYYYIFIYDENGKQSATVSCDKNSGYRLCSDEIFFNGENGKCYEKPKNGDAYGYLSDSYTTEITCPTLD